LESVSGDNFCHPDEASNASGRTWLLASGQLRASEAGTGFEIAQRSFEILS
jgi:hypothetical protein